MLKHENEELFCRMNEMEQYSRKRNIVISGIPFEEEENTKAVVQKFASGIRIELKDYEINAVHRLSTKKEHTPIIVCLNNLEKKEELIEWSKRNNKKQGANKKPIFISEHLTRFNGELLREAKQREDVKYAWVKNGRILIKRSEESKVEELRSFQQLEEADAELRSLQQQEEAAVDPEKEDESQTEESEDEIKSNETVKKTKGKLKQRQASIDQFLATPSKAKKHERKKQATMNNKMNQRLRSYGNGKK